MTGEAKPRPHSRYADGESAKVQRVLSYRVTVHHLVRAILELADHAALTDQTRRELLDAVKEGRKHGER